MNDISVKTMIDEYLSWYKSKTTIKQLEKAEVIVTPFVNHLNDRISIFVEILDATDTDNIKPFNNYLLSFSNKYIDMLYAIKKKKKIIYCF